SARRPRRMDAAKYSVTERLRDGRQVEIRALRPQHRSELVLAVEHSSTQSLYRRFFAVKRKFSEREIASFLNIDFITHVALVAVLAAGDRSAIVGGARYIIIRPRTAEMALRARLGAAPPSRSDRQGRRDHGAAGRSLAG